MDTTCSPIDKPVNTYGILLGAVLATATFLLPFPQVVKLLRQRSSAGLSPYTIALTVLFAGAQVGATVGLKWRQLQECAHGPACIKDLLDLLQQLASWVTWTATALICVSLPPNNAKHPVVCTALSCACTLALTTAIAVVSDRAPCGPAALAFAQALGWVAAAAAVCQFGPQLYETWRHGSAGSLSYVTYLIQAVGSAAVVVNNAFFNHDTWPVWLPLSVATAMQSGVLVLTIYLKRHPREAPPSAINEGLLKSPVASAGSDAAELGDGQA